MWMLITDKLTAASPFFACLPLFHLPPPFSQHWICQQDKMKYIHSISTAESNNEADIEDSRLK
jgi:hypothetical protein